MALDLAKLQKHMCGFGVKANVAWKEHVDVDVVDDKKSCWVPRAELSACELAGRTEEEDDSIRGILKEI